MITESLIIFLITLVPFLELRASIPYGIIVGVPWWIVLIVAILSNIIVAFFAYFLWSTVIQWFRKINFIEKIYQKFIIRTQKKIHKYVDKYGILGLAVFIGIPLPGSGVYTGALASQILNMNFRQYIKAAAIGVIIAGIIVTIIMLSGIQVLDVFVKHVL